MRHYKEAEWEEKYGSMSEEDLKDAVKSSISNKLSAVREKKAEGERQNNGKYNLSYSELTKAIPKTRELIAELEGKPEELRLAKRAKLEKECRNLIKYERLSPDVSGGNTNEMWIMNELSKWMVKDEEYNTAKRDLAQAQKDLAIYLADKESWEKDHAELIRAERERTERQQLLSADPEALRELGIEPVEVISKDNTD